MFSMSYQVKKILKYLSVLNTQTPTVNQTFNSIFVSLKHE